MTMTQTVTPVAVPARATARWRLLARRPTFLVGAAIIAAWVVFAIFGGAIAAYSPLSQSLLAANTGPSGAHWFGTDQLGRDVLARVITGSRDILIITPLATLLGTVCGTALGLAMGYLGGVLDLIASRIVEAVLAERDLDYLPAARLLGAGTWSVMLVEILPNVLPAILVEFSVRLGYAIFAVATLSFLGFGIQPPTPDWGSDIAANYGVLAAGYWWETLFPALAIASLIVAVNLITDSMEQVMSS